MFHGSVSQMIYMLIRLPFEKENDSSAFISFPTQAAMLSILGNITPAYSGVS